MPVRYACSGGWNLRAVDRHKLNSPLRHRLPLIFDLAGYDNTIQGVIIAATGEKDRHERQANAKKVLPQYCSSRMMHVLPKKYRIANA